MGRRPKSKPPSRDKFMVLKSTASALQSAVLGLRRVAKKHDEVTLLICRGTSWRAFPQRDYLGAPPEWADMGGAFHSASSRKWHVLVHAHHEALVALQRVASTGMGAALDLESRWLKTSTSAWNPVPRNHPAGWMIWLAELAADGKLGRAGDAERRVWMLSPEHQRAFELGSDLSAWEAARKAPPSMVRQLATGEQPKGGYYFTPIQNAMALSCALIEGLLFETNRRLEATDAALAQGKRGIASNRGIQRAIRVTQGDAPVVTLLSAGLSYRKIEEQTGVSKTSVGRIAKANRLTAPRSKGAVPPDGTEGIFEKYPEHSGNHGRLWARRRSQRYSE